MNPNASCRPVVTLAAALVALALAGCAVTQPPGAALPALAVPSTWSSSHGVVVPDASPQSLARWWQGLGDAQLSTLVEQALQANPSLRATQAALRQSRAQRDVTAAGLAPSLDGSGSAQRSRSGNSTGNSFSAGLDASWELDVFGRLASGLEASDADVRTAQATLEGARVSLAAEVALTYIDLRNQQQRLVIARNNLASQRETLQITDWRMQAGLTTSLATEQAKAAVEQTAAQVPTLEASLAQSRHALAVLTGQNPAALNAQLAAVAPVPQAPTELALQIPAETLRQRPDVIAAETRVAAALARVSQADAARYPSFRLGGSLGLRALTLGTLTQGGSVVGALLSSISVPLLDGGAARAQVRVQQEGLEQARLAYVSTVLTALQEVEDALAAVQGDAQRRERLQAAVEAAQNAALLAQQRYSSGLVDFQTVLETQRSQLSSQDSLATATATLTADHVRLYKALGGGWTPQPAEATAGAAAAAPATN
ncbi:efflux transporter outer membrane subunit [Acidovorax sp. Be4]|uniref:Efflux transporter outer membrane subunit n=1 Tax=Acidovorax bellezanensis TaxID=2976702 RepID=A0ABT2PH05_9BURK|nr:efflux transporter outer membrane subunit [Acidovorax sp. Be4]MCT9809721.1 efflux transporter outer membrane subunit [Acidovorax sp. Be4]